MQTSCTAAALRQPACSCVPGSHWTPERTLTCLPPPSIHASQMPCICCPFLSRACGRVPGAAARRGADRPVCRCDGDGCCLGVVQAAGLGFGIGGFCIIQTGAAMHAADYARPWLLHASSGQEPLVLPTQYQGMVPAWSCRAARARARRGAAGGAALPKIQLFRL